jgi:hypothetical protein
MTAVYLSANDNFPIGSGATVYGQAGVETIRLIPGAVDVQVNSLVEQIELPENVSDYKFQQDGTQLKVYSDDELVTSIAIQDDADGTQLVFGDELYSVIYGEGFVMELGGTVVPDDVPGHIVPGDDDTPEVTFVGIDTGTLTSPAIFDAADGAYNFVDDAAVAGNVTINNFTGDDIISFSNADESDYFFQSEDTDVTLSYNYNDEGTMNVITLTGVVSSDALVYDLASFTDAVGFDSFG